MATQSKFDRDFSGAPTLEAFINAARVAGEDGEVHVKIDGSNYLVLATGKTASGRDVSWIANTEPDATSIYLSVFQKYFGNRITSAILEHFSDELSPGKPLAARTVTLALEMADRSLTVLSGVDFLTKLHSSAVARGHNFDQVCMQLGIDTSTIEPEARTRIDNEIQRLFRDAFINGESPVESNRLQQWLEEAIRREVG